MADPSPSDDDRAAPAQDGSTPPGIPRWVKVLALAVVVVVVVVAGGLVVLAGDHGPGRHTQHAPSGLVVAAQA